MTSGLARNGGRKRELLSAIRQKLDREPDAKLRPAEAVLILEWAVEADDPSCKTELLNIFDAMGGLTLIKDIFDDLH